MKKQTNTQLGKYGVEQVRRVRPQTKHDYNTVHLNYKKPEIIYTYHHIPEIKGLFRVISEALRMANLSSCSVIKSKGLCLEFVGSTEMISNSLNNQKY